MSWRVSYNCRLNWSLSLHDHCALTVSYSIPQIHTFTFYYEVKRKKKNRHKIDIIHVTTIYSHTDSRISVCIVNWFNQIEFEMEPVRGKGWDRERENDPILQNIQTIHWSYFVRFWMLMITNMIIMMLLLLLLAKIFRMAYCQIQCN